MTLTTESCVRFSVLITSLYKTRNLYFQFQSCKLFLRNLPISVTSERLTLLIRQLVTRDCLVKLYRFKDFAFAHFRNKGEARMALSLLRSKCPFLDLFFSNCDVYILLQFILVAAPWRLSGESRACCKTSLPSGISKCKFIILLLLF